MISFQKACEMSGLKACDFAKSASVSEMRKWMKTADFQNAEVSSTGDLPRAHTGEDKDLSLDKSNSSPSDLSKKFSKTFVGAINEVKFPERIFRAIKDNWEAVSESKLSATEMAEAYNDYVSEARRGNDKFSHPNSWIIGRGWENTSKEVSDEPAGDYDF